MRTTLRIDDDVLLELKRRAQKDRSSLTRIVNRILRRGLTARDTTARRRRYREKPASMGRPRANLDRSLALAAALEDESVAEKTKLRK